MLPQPHRACARLAGLGHTVAGEEGDKDRAVLDVGRVLVKNGVELGVADVRVPARAGMDIAVVVLRGCEQGSKPRLTAFGARAQTPSRTTHGHTHTCMYVHGRRQAVHQGRLLRTLPTGRAGPPLPRPC